MEEGKICFALPDGSAEKFEEDMLLGRSHYLDETAEAYDTRKLRNTLLRNGRDAYETFYYETVWETYETLRYDTLELRNTLLRFGLVANLATEPNM